MQHVSDTAKIFKYTSECFFHKAQLMAMHNTVTISNTNGVPPSETHMQIHSSSEEPPTVGQFKYQGNGASENMTTYMTIYIQFKIQGTNKQF